MKIKYFLLIPCLLICNYQHASEPPRKADPFNLFEPDPRLEDQNRLHIPDDDQYRFRVIEITFDVRNNTDSYSHEQDPDGLKARNRAVTIAIAQGKVPGKVWSKDGQVYYSWHDLDGYRYGQTMPFPRRLEPHRWFTEEMFSECTSEHMIAFFEILAGESEEKFIWTKFNIETERLERKINLIDAPTSNLKSSDESESD